VTNPQQASGGSDDQSSSSIKAYAPLFAATGGQLNTQATLQAFVDVLAGVSRSKVTRIGNRLQIMILPQSGLDSSVLTSYVQSKIASRILMGFTIGVIPAQFQEVTVVVNITAADSANVTDVQSAVLTQIGRWLDPLGKDDNGLFLNDFGQPLKLSVLLGLLKGIPTNLIVDYAVVSPPTNVSIATNAIVTNTHTVTPAPVINIVGGLQTPTIDRPFVFAQ